MLEAKELIVLSDIHMGPEYGKGLFRADKELANCLNWILENKDDCYIVFAGDVFDYLVLGEKEQIADFYNFRDVESRTRNIVEKHSDVFDSLAKLAESEKHQLLFIAGNHDPELVFPKAQRVIEKRLANSLFKPLTRWIVQGETLQINVGSAKILIEHGNVFDKFNRVDYNGLREILSLINRGFSINTESFYSIPYGSKIVLEHVIPIRNDFPWLDYLQPGAEAVYPIMREFTTLKQKASFIKSLKDGFWITAKDELTRLKASRDPAVLYRSGENDNFQSWLNFEAEHQEEQRGIIFKAPNDELVKELISKKQEVFSINTPDYTYEDVEYILQNDINLVITGHTHKAKIYPVGNGLYINTGTWAQLLETPEKDAPEEIWLQFIENLRKGSQWEDKSFTRTTFANVIFDVESKKTSASLMEWRRNVPNTLSSWIWNDELSKWEE